MTKLVLGQNICGTNVSFDKFSFEKSLTTQFLDLLLTLNFMKYKLSYLGSTGVGFRRYKDTI